MNPTLKHICDIDAAKTAELDRLRAINADLLTALKAIFAVSTPHIAEYGQSPWQIARAAIEKHGKGE